MKITFVSNFYNHHQAFLSRKLYQLTNGEYRFVATTEVPIERRSLGYSADKDNFVIYYPESTLEALDWIDSADIVIFGSAPIYLLQNRIKEKKIVFKYSEHLLKKGFQWWKYPIRWWRWHRNNPAKAPIYMLCASAYTAGDYAKFGLFKGKTYKWGYFPECKKYENIDALMQQKDPKQILWCGRFLDWKHPDDVLTVAKRLKEENYSFHIQIIGTGEMEEELKTLIQRDGLQDVVTLLGSMPPEKVRQHMEQAGIYLFTSDRKEGWGAVLNESMNSGCAVIASCAAGSTPYLIRHGENGLSYSNCDTDALYGHIKYLLEHPKAQDKMGRAAYESIVSEWNADVAATRMVQLAQHILQVEKTPELFSNGPCSRA